LALRSSKQPIALISPLAGKLTGLETVKTQLGYLPKNQLFMADILWGLGAVMPPLGADAVVYVADRGKAVPSGTRYSVVGFDARTTERYWASRRARRNRVRQRQSAAVED